MMKILLKILVAPFALALSLLTALLVFLFDICAFLLTIASVILAVLGIALFFTPTPIGGIVFLFLAFLLSPYGLQAAASSILWALDGGKFALYRFLASYIILHFVLDYENVMGFYIKYYFISLRLAYKFLLS